MWLSQVKSEAVAGVEPEEEGEVQEESDLFLWSHHPLLLTAVQKQMGLPQPSPKL